MSDLCALLPSKLPDGVDISVFHRARRGVGGFAAPDYVLIVLNWEEGCFEVDFAACEEECGTDASCVGETWTVVEGML